MLLKIKEENHYLIGLFNAFNSAIENYFDGKDGGGNSLTQDNLLGRELKIEIDKYLDSFTKKKSAFKVTEAKLRFILERLELDFLHEINLGLGSYNLLFMAAELLHLNKVNYEGLKLGLVEEIEAHLHPQIQLQVMDSLQKIPEIQLIFTTHSPNIGSKINLENLFIFKDSIVFPMGSNFTQLSDFDYRFLQRFLDVTKANLFFAKGIIMVEGWAEEFIVPQLAKKLELNLTEMGISVVNIGNTAFLRYSKIFQRKDEPYMIIPVSIVTDIDIMPDEETDDILTEKKRQKQNMFNGQSVKTFVSPHWTLEYCISLSSLLRKLLFKSVLLALKESAS